jgi:hypothetical protein
VCAFVTHSLKPRHSGWKNTSCVRSMPAACRANTLLVRIGLEARVVPPLFNHGGGAASHPGMSHTGSIAAHYSVQAKTRGCKRRQS